MASVLDRCLSTLERYSVALRALGAQTVAALLVLAALLARTQLVAPASPYAVALLEGALAALFSLALNLPRWWMPIQLGFAPLAVFAFDLRVDPLWYLGAFVALALVFGAVHAGRVPLYLSSETAIAQLLSRVPRERDLAFLDLGCGLGSVLDAVSRARPRARCAGIEAAPLPWLAAAVRGALARPGFRVAYGSFWNRSLGQWDIVFAYLSPAAMPRLWTKAKLEMRPGSLLISNSFPIPDIVPTEQVARTGCNGKALFIYRI